MGRQFTGVKESRAGAVPDATHRAKALARYLAGIVRAQSRSGGARS